MIRATDKKIYEIRQKEQSPKEAVKAEPVKEQPVLKVQTQQIPMHTSKPKENTFKSLREKLFSSNKSS
jgi:hypothetical protein